MRCLVTGAAGFIGSKVAERLITDGHVVHLTDKANPYKLLPWRRDIWCSIPDTRWHIYDLRSHEHNDLWLTLGLDLDAVFHLAANVGGVGYLAYHDLDAYRDNMAMSSNVLSACDARDVGRVFYASSSCAYPTGPQRHGSKWQLHEHDVAYGEPDGPMYGYEKRVTAAYGEQLRQAGRLDVRSGYINSAYGPGLAIEGERMKFPAAIVRKVLDARRTGGPVEIWGDGRQRRGYIYIDDLVSKIVRVTLGGTVNYGDDLYAGPVNLTSPETVSCNEVAALAMQLLGVDCEVKHVDGPTGPEARRCSNAGWERTFGRDDQPSFADRFAQFVEWMTEVVDST